MRSLWVIVWLGIGCASTHTPRDYSTSEVVTAASLLGVTALGATVVRAARSSPPPRATRDTPTTPPTTRAEHLAALATWQTRCDEGDTAACRAHTQRLAELAARTYIAIGPPLAADLVLIDRTDTTVTARFVKGLPLYPGWHGNLSLRVGHMDLMLASARIDELVADDAGGLVRLTLIKHHSSIEGVDLWAPKGHLIFTLPRKDAPHR